MHLANPRFKNKYKYLVFYKPFGVLSSFTDPENRPTLKGFIPDSEVYPAGRLDMDSEGFLFLTNDGNLIHQITHPYYHLPKTYLVQVDGIMSPQAMRNMEMGVSYGGNKTRGCQIIQIPKPEIPERQVPVVAHGPVQWLRIVLREGKKRQIRHMTAAVGFPTLRLIRVAIGPIGLNDLQPGEWRALTPYEIGLLCIH